MMHGLVLHAAMQVISLGLCGGGCCTLITQCATGVQPHPAPEYNKTGPGKLLQPAILHTHSYSTHTHHPKEADPGVDVGPAERVAVDPGRW